MSLNVYRPFYLRLQVLTTDSNNCVHNESSFHPENLDERNPDPTSHGRSRVVDNQTHSFKKIGNDYPSIPLIPDEDSSVPVEYCRRTPIPQEYQPSMIRNCDEGQCPFGACESHFDDYSTPSGSMTDTDSRIRKSSWTLLQSGANLAVRCCPMQFRECECILPV